MSNPPEKQKYKIVGPATWELIRAAYLAGESATTLAERYGVSPHAIRKRITIEKWSKRDYAAALEARGLEPPKPAGARLNIAERFAANYAAPAAPPQPEHPFMELVDALKQASAVAEAQAPTIASDEPGADIADLLESRALAQVGQALSKGRASDAKAFASLAEQMRQRAAGERAELAVKAEAEQLSVEQREHMVSELFGNVAEVALAMVHNPTAAPAVFLQLIKRWREINLGEGEADSEARAGKIAASHQHYIDGSWAETVPEDVRAYFAQRWQETRTRLVT